MVLVVMTGMLLAGCAGMHLKRANCDMSQGPSGFLLDYTTHNAQALRVLGSTGLTIAGAVLGQAGGANSGALADTPNAWTTAGVRPKLGFDYVGLGLSFLKSNAFAGVSPNAVLNMAAGLACHEFVMDQPPSVALSLGTDGVRVQ